MISVKPGALAFAILTMLVNEPGEVDAEVIAASLLPAPRFLPPPSTMPVSDRLRALYAHDQRREAHASEATAKVARLLGRLVEAGYVAPRRGPLLSEVYLTLEASRGRRLALEFAALEHRGKVRPRHLALVRRVVEFLPPSREALLGKHPERAYQEAYRELVTWGVLVPPSQRVPTEAGVELVERAVAGVAA